jgi:formylglycine-generating enzyme required for sulfatase activity
MSAEEVPAPPSSTDREMARVLGGASPGRLALRVTIAIAVLGSLGAGAWLGYGRVRRANALDVAMVSLRANEVPIGSDSRWRGRLQGGLQETPSHTVPVAAFSIDKTEVTVEAYRACMESGACTAPAKADGCTWLQTDGDKHPVNCVTFDQAEAFCKFVGKRLPNEVEWEYAAGGLGGKRLFPWGDALPTRITANLCGTECTYAMASTENLAKKEICHDAGCRSAAFDDNDKFPRTAPVGSFPDGDTPDGLSDMAGNVWEWTSSAPCGYPDHACTGTERVIRGSGWTHRYVLSPEVTTREKMPMSSVSEGVGFRCAR